MPLDVVFASCYRVEAVVPPGVRLGVPYELRLDNGLRGPGIPAGGAAAVVPRLVFGATDGGWPATRAIELVQLDRPNVYKDLLPPEHPDYGKDKPLTRPSIIRDVSFTGLDITTDGRIHLIGKPGQPIQGSNPTT